MKVNLVKWTNVVTTIKSNRDMQKAFYKFHLKLKEVEWKIPNDVLKTFNNADIINCKVNNRIVFNVGGNKYRLICGYHFGESFIQLFIKFAGTHEEYDLIDACKIEMYKK